MIRGRSLTRFVLPLSSRRPLSRLWNVTQPPDTSALLSPVSEQHHSPRTSFARIGPAVLSLRAIEAASRHQLSVEDQ